jgi:phosphatidylserine/phosphatidylglycerophosphate/cardiolipin synthase-like enzyme
VSVIDQPGPIDIESEEMGPFRETLDAIAAKGTQAHVILPANISGTGQRDVDFLRQHGVQVRLMPVHPLYVHSKIVIAADEAFVGSENFTRTSLEVNREAGVITHNQQDIEKMKEQFTRDWATAK